jgi:hypothetical protein
MARAVDPSRCPRCSSPLVEIRIAQGESTLRMRSCSTCDTRQWDTDGRVTGLDSVLAEVATKKR